MSIHTLKEALKDIVGADALTMFYEEGGKVEVYSTPTKAVRVRPGATAEEIRKAFEEK